MQIAEALRLLRTLQGLSQTAAGQLDGAPDFRTISHWETRRKLPSIRLLTGYLAALGLDFHDLQDALDQVGSVGATVGKIAELDRQVDRMARVVEDLGERRMAVLERRLLALERDDIAAAVAALRTRLEAIEGLTETVRCINAQLLYLQLNAATLDGAACLESRVEALEERLMTSEPGEGGTDE